MPCRSPGNRSDLVLDCGLSGILVQSFRPPGNPLRFRNLVAIRFDCEDCGQDSRPDILGPVWVGSRPNCDSGQSWSDLRHLVAIRMNCVRIALNLQSIHNPQGLQKIVPALPGFRVDCEWMSILGATGDVFLQFVDFPRFWCNPFNPLTILCGFAISPQFNSIVKIAVGIAVLIFSVSRTGLHCC